uniref:Consortin C-terminal domain-containing protein n=1 Tax=Periophthalmus magnuspinnatus TaxID=409849 RepID=A0A3B3ZCF9_9GOBI
MSQEVELCDNIAVSTVNLNKLAQTQSSLASDNENVGQQGSIPKAPFDGKNYEHDKPDKDIRTGQLDEDQDEVMKEEEDNSEESSLIGCQSPETPMTDSSYSETGMLAPTPGLVSILKKRAVYNASPTATGPELQSNKLPAQRRVRFKVPDDGFDNEMGGGDSCLLLFLLCLVTVVISIGGTALYCALGDAHSSVCQDFSRNADFYFGQLQRGISQIQHWFTPTS